MRNPDLLLVAPHSAEACLFLQATLDNLLCLLIGSLMYLMAHVMLMSSEANTYSTVACDYGETKKLLPLLGINHCQGGSSNNIT